MIKRVVAVASCLLAVASAKQHIQERLRNREILSRAANLGGWLVSEYWMSYTSPLYKGVPEDIARTGEYGVMTYLGKEQGTKQFEEHWKTWITEKDIAEIAKSGLNTVRVSTGYWIINDEDDSDQSEVAQTYAKGGLKYLDKLINEWAVKYNLAVMISLHAHKGSQNGNDHSAPIKMWTVTWSDSPDNVKSSLNYAKFIANRYKNSKAFLGLNLMNEPTRPLDYGVLLQYYKDAYKAIRDDGNDCIIGTSPWLENQGPPTMADFMPCPEYYNVWHEFHVYYKWGWEQASKDSIFSEAAKYGQTHYDGWTGNPVFLGEWSLATPDEVQLTDADFTKFGEIQMKEAEKSPAGWAFWAWRHDDETKITSGWSMRQLIRKGLLAIPSTEAKRTRNPLCPTGSNKTSSGSGDGSVGASGSGSNGSISFFTPEKVKPADTENNATSSVPTVTPASAASLKVVGASFVLAATTAFVWTL